jgi:23S rRNA pseudouridine2605 synthase
MERLQKILSQAGIASRRASERLMLEGRVTVNGATIRELGTKADPVHDDIRVDGRRIVRQETRRYLLLNKPRGYVTTRSDPQQRPTVIDLLKGVREYVYPVGRLDFDSEGLLLLTNDGDLAAKLTHPRHGIPRVYEARVLGVPDQHDLDRLRKGIVIDGQKTAPAGVVMTSAGRARQHDGAKRAARPSRDTRTTVLLFTVFEGRNRQVRKMCDAIGHPVDHLRRVAIGPLRDAKLQPGRYRDLTLDEVNALRRAASSTSKPEKPRRQV